MTRLGLTIPPSKIMINNEREDPQLTELGYAFASACEDPSLIEQAKDMIRSEKFDNKKFAISTLNSPPH